MRRLLLGCAVLPLGLRAAAPLVLMATVWWLSSLPHLGGDVGTWSSFWHNGAHVIAYGSIGGAWMLLFHRDGGWSRRHLVFAVLLSAAYGIVDELHQSHVPGRVCSASDVATDTVGAWLGATLVLAITFPSPRARGALPWLFLASIGCVSLATWGPW